MQLGDILRLALHNDATGLVPLKTELEYIRLYLQIEQTRLRDRLEVRYAVEPEALDAAVPNLILLPLTESAIANGMSLRPGRAGRSKSAPAPENGDLLLEVQEEAAEPRGGSARETVPIDDSFVRKTKLRLELLYPGTALVAISDRLDKGHEVLDHASSRGGRVAFPIRSFRVSAIGGPFRELPRAASRDRWRAADGCSRRGRSSDSSARRTAISATRSSSSAWSSASGKRSPRACSSSTIWAALHAPGDLARAPVHADALGLAASRSPASPAAACSSRSRTAWPTSSRIRS